MKRSRISASLAFTALLVMPLSAIAADGTWTFAGNGSWDTPGNWSGNIIADGAGSTATFGPIAGTIGNVEITVDTPRIIENLSFESTTGNTHNFTLSGPAVLSLQGSSTPTIIDNAYSRTSTISATLGGNQGVSIANIASGSILTLSGNNTYTGQTTVSGILTLSGNNALGAGGTGNETILNSNSGILLTDGIKVTDETLTISSGDSYGSLRASGTAEWSGNIIINSNGRVGTANSSSQLTISGKISDGTTTSLIVSGTGITMVSGVSDYTGGTTLYRGTLKLDGGNNRLPTGTTVTLGGTADNSTFDLNGYNQQLSAIANNNSNKSSRTVTNSSVTTSTLTLSGSSNASFLGDADDLTFITGNLSIIKAGIFNQTLAKTNTYTGNTTINAGTLTLADDATMTFFIGANGVNNQILGTGALVLNGDFIFDLSGASAVNGNSWLIADFAHLNESIGGTFTVQGFSKTGSDWTFGDYTFSEASGILSYGTLIPEPTTAAALTGLTALGLVALRRRRDLA